MGPFTPTTSRLNNRHLPSTISALTILVPQRGYATEPSVSSGSGGPPSFPPPGFNAQQAKKPLPRDVPRKSAESADKAITEESKASSPVEKVTVVDKVAAIPDFHASVESEATEKKAAAEKETKKLTLGQKIKHEVQHYWDGTKLLAAEVRISTRLALKMAAGYELTRRESKQVRGNLAILLHYSFEQKS